MSELIRIQVNGEMREWRSGVTVADLLRDLEIGADRVAVEVNLQIVDRAKFADHRLRDGDRVEILSFIGGGHGGPAGQHQPFFTWTFVMCCPRGRTTERSGDWGSRE